jgi:uncharacterized SAM-dependent methyltransferase
MLIDKKTSESQLDNEFARDVKEGLSMTNNKKMLKPKYFYDKIGSQLFEQICHQPRCEKISLDIIKIEGGDLVE